MVRGIRRHVRTVVDDLGMRRAKSGCNSVCGRALYHGCLLVHRFHIVCKPRRDDRSGTSSRPAFRDGPRAASDRAEGLYLSPLTAGAQDYTVSVLHELVARYPIDGLHLRDGQDRLHGTR